MAIAVERVERHVADHADLRQRLFDRAYGAADQLSGLPASRASGVFSAGPPGKQGNGGNAQRGGFAHRIDQAINT